MKIEISIQEIGKQREAIRSGVNAQIWFCLGRCTSAIRRIEVQIEPADQLDYRCQCSLSLKFTKDKLTVSAHEHDPLDALVACLDRCRRTVERRLHVAAIDAGRARRLLPSKSR